VNGNVIDAVNGIASCHDRLRSGHEITVRVVRCIAFYRVENFRDLQEY